MNIDQVRDLLRKACDEAGGQRAYSRKTGVDVSHVNKVLRWPYEPCPRLLDALGLRSVKAYEPKDAE